MMQSVSTPDKQRKLHVMPVYAVSRPVVQAAGARNRPRARESLQFDACAHGVTLRTFRIPLFSIVVSPARWAGTKCPCTCAPAGLCLPLPQAQSALHMAHSVRPRPQNTRRRTFTYARFCHDFTNALRHLRVSASALLRQPSQTVSQATEVSCNLERPSAGYTLAIPLPAAVRRSLNFCRNQLS